MIHQVGRLDTSITSLRTDLKGIGEKVVVLQTEVSEMGTVSRELVNDKHQDLLDSIKQQLNHEPDPLALKKLVDWGTNLMQVVRMFRVRPTKISFVFVGRLWGWFVLVVVKF